ncbi:MAG: hypothetical protein ACKOBW_04320 [Planctomycetota bacterium]
MSYLNRAFIRAYDRQPSELHPAGVPLRTVNQFHIPTASTQLLAACGQALTTATLALFPSPVTPRGLLFVRGTQPQAGRTTVAICLAQSLAAQGLKLALIDADPRHAGCRQLLGDDTSAIDLRACYSHRDQFTILPLPASPMALTPFFDLLVVDTPCWSSAVPESSAEFQLLSGADETADCVSLIVTDARPGAISNVQPLMRELQQTDQTRIGLVENFSNHELHSHFVPDSHCAKLPHAPPLREELVHV